MNLPQLPVSHISFFVLRVQSFVHGNHGRTWLALILDIAKSIRQSLVNAFCYFMYMKTSNNQNWIRECI